MQDKYNSSFFGDSLQYWFVAINNSEFIKNSEDELVVDLKIMKNPLLKSTKKLRKRRRGEGVKFFSRNPPFYPHFCLKMFQKSFIDFIENLLIYL